MESNHVRDLMEAYSSIYAENEEVEQLDEDFQGAVEGALEAGARKTNEFMKKYPVVGAIGAALSPAGPGRKTPTKASGGYRPVVKSTVGEEADLFDIIKGHLLDEGFADTEEAALAIMTNMSEEWREQILDERTRGEQGMSDSEVSRRRNLGGNTRFNVSSGALGDHGSQGAIQKFHKRKSGLRKAIHKSGRNTRGDTGESGGKGRYEANKDHTDGYPSITKRGQGPG